MPNVQAKVPISVDSGLRGLRVAWLTWMLWPCLGPAKCVLPE